MEKIRPRPYSEATSWKAGFWTLLSIIVLTGNLFFTLPAVAKSSEQTKNVLFIFVDDLNTELNCYGNSIVHSPNIDRLADKGTRFTNAYCQWSVCGPSRASILSGQMPAQSGIRNLTTQLRDVNPNVVTLPQYFKNRGYKTAAVGKIFDPRNVDDGHDEVSWSLPYSIKYSYPEEYGDFVKGQYRITDNTATEMGPEGVDDDGYLDGQICLDALSKLESFAAKPEQPFFLAVGFKKPHIPFIAPKKYWDLYKREDMPLAAFQRLPQGSPEYSLHTPEPMQYDDIPNVWTYNDMDRGDEILEPELQKQLVHGYYACISYIDAQVGKLLNKLDELNLDDKTLVVLLSDHGYHLGDHNQWGKHTQYENALNVPLMIYQPGQEKSIVNVPVDLLDLYPTITSLIFNQLPENTTGTSLIPVLNGMETAEIPAVSEYRSSGHASYSFRNAEQRLTLWMRGSDDRPDQMEWDISKVLTAELYDYDTDALETINLYQDSAYDGILDNMLVQSKNWWTDQYNKINNISTGARSLQNDELTPVPNPVHDYLKLSGNTSEMELRIYDLSGKMVLQQQSPSAETYVGDLKPGRYVVLLAWQKMDEVLNYSFVKM